MGSLDPYLEPGEGELVDLGGVGVHFKIRSEKTGGAFAVVEHPVAPATIVEPPRISTRTNSPSCCRDAVGASR